MATDPSEVEFEELRGRGWSGPAWAAEFRDPERGAEVLVDALGARGAVLVALAVLELEAVKR